MSDLLIGRMSASVTDWPDDGHVPVMLRHLAEDRLDDALREHPLPDGEWCVRRLDIALELDPERPLSALETGWADRILAVLRQSLRDGSSDVVRYERPEQAVDDLLRGLTLRRYDRAWAWRQVRLLEPGDPEPAAEPRAVFLRALARLHHAAGAALTRLVADVGAAPLHRLLGSEGWVHAGVIVARDAGIRWAPGSTLASVDGDERQAADIGDGPRASSVDGGGRRAEALDSVERGARRTAHAGREASGPAAAEYAAVERLAAAVAASGVLASALLRSGLRVDDATLESWALIAIADLDPVLLRRDDATRHALVRAVAARLAPHADRQPTLGLATAAVPAPRRASAPKHGSGKATRDDIRGDTEPPRADSFTAWGGLLFLLNTAAEASIPTSIAEPPFLARHTGWALHHLAVRLAAAEPDDPALLAFSGLTAPPSADEDEPERQALDACATRWTTATADRLRAAGTQGDDAELVARVLRRDARVIRDPGCVEISLPVADVDLDVRRAGLDLDPGWVAWLGQVVRFRYE
jgi:hypothetical protein